MGSRGSSAVLAVCAGVAAACSAPEPEVSGELVELIRVESERADTFDLPQRELGVARETATALAQDLAGLVFSTLEADGPVAAIRVCSEVAEQRTAAHAADGVYVRRISDRLRSPVNAADADEARELERMHMLEADGRLPPEIIRVVERGPERTLHLLRPIRVQPPCLTCHGDPDAIPADVRRILAERYPDDQATGYSVGDLRGAVSVRVRVTDR
jgi:hypothetical protein